MADLARQGRDVTEQMEQGVFTSNQATDPAQGGAVAGTFARKFNARTGRDNIMEMKAAMMNPQTGQSSFGEVQATDSDFRWAQKKADLVEEGNDSFNFCRWSA